MTEGKLTTRYRWFFAGAGTMYVLVAIMTGAAMSRAIPALNGLGATYAGATWPMAMFCAATQLDCSPLPEPGSPLANSFFTFHESSHD